MYVIHKYTIIISNMASKLYGVNANIIMFIFVFYCVNKTHEQ